MSYVPGYKLSIDASDEVEINVVADVGWSSDIVGSDGLLVVVFASIVAGAVDVAGVVVVVGDLLVEINVVADGGPTVDGVGAASAVLVVVASVPAAAVFVAVVVVVVGDLVVIVSTPTASIR